MYGPLRVMTPPIGDGDAIAPVICIKCKEIHVAKAVIKNNKPVLIEKNCTKCKTRYKLPDPDWTCPNCGEKEMMVSK
jgi:Zn finger protein HypA/HybF involved in hydrogenase expression